MNKKMATWYSQSFIRHGLSVLLALSIIFLFYKVAFLLTPLLDFISTLFAPIIISFVFYYLLRPLVYMLEKMRIPRFISILSIYLSLTVVVVLFFAYIGPIVGQQITELADLSVKTLEKVQIPSKSLLFNFINIDVQAEVEQRIVGFMQQATTVISKSLLEFVGLITRVATVLAVIPFIVFYLLKDDEDFVSGFMRYIPEYFGREAHKILRNIDTTLSKYINGLVLVASSVGIMLFIGYLIIGIQYALVLALVAVVFTTIPFLGPFLAIAPAILVASLDGSFMVIKVITVFAIAQQLESNLISPQIIGQRLHIHPLTLILLLLAAGSLYGLVGLILVTPIYAISKVFIANFYKIYLLRYPPKSSLQATDN
jgi:predicted PurR-regulated permease PerM